MIGDVDCTTTDGGKLCSQHEVKGYPTLKHFNSTTGAIGETYEGPRNFDGLKKFVTKTLKGVIRKCDVSSKKDCLPEEIEYVQKWELKSVEERSIELKRLKSKLDDVLKANVREALDFEFKLLKMVDKATKQKKEEL